MHWDAGVAGDRGEKEGVGGGVTVRAADPGVACRYQGGFVATRATSRCHVQRGISPWKICTNFSLLCTSTCFKLSTNVYAQIQRVDTR